MGEKNNFISPGLEARNVGTLQQQNIKEIKNLTLEEVIAKINAGDIAEPVKYTLELDTLTADKQLDISGNFFGVVDASAANATISVKFNKNQSESIAFTKGLYMTRPYNKVFLSWAAQTGASIQIMIASMNKDLFEIQDFRSETTSSADLATIKAHARSLNGDTGTQILKNAASINNTEVVLHTVTAGKTLYLTNAVLNNYASSGNAYLQVKNAADVLQYNLIFMEGQVDVIAHSYTNPVKIPAGYKIVGKSVTAGNYVSPSIQGWEE